MWDLVRKIIKKEKVRYYEPKPLLVSLLHCLCEAQDQSLCRFVAEQLDGYLNLGNTTLSLVDCLVIGYFLSSVSLTTSSVKGFRVDLNNCSIGDAGTKSLMRSICRSVIHNTITTHVVMYLECNEIHEEGASHIAEVLSKTSIINRLWLGSVTKDCKVYLIL